MSRRIPWYTAVGLKPWQIASLAVPVCVSVAVVSASIKKMGVAIRSFIDEHDNTINTIKAAQKKAEPNTYAIKNLEAAVLVQTSLIKSIRDDLDKLSASVEKIAQVQSSFNKSTILPSNGPQ
uniref:Uncharacterized protein n=1 Tax=Panagrolaimus davidi TaxID=227884 RepID=A0A914R3V1_9BILA